MSLSGFDGFFAAIDALQQAASGNVARLPGGQADDGLTPAQRFTNMPDDARWANEANLPEADPGFAWAEDLTQVPLDFWD